MRKCLNIRRGPCLRQFLREVAPADAHGLAMSTEVASTRLPKEILREIDREAAARGISRSVHLADLIERRASHDAAAAHTNGQAEALVATLGRELRALHEDQRSLAQVLRELQAAIRVGAPSSMDSASPLLERLAFSTFFSESLIKRVSRRLYRDAGELGQVVREAREEALAEAKLWRERSHGGESPKGSV